MSSGRETPRAEALKELLRELRQAQGLGASFFRAAAARTGMTVTDLQVLDILKSTGLTTAGQLAEMTGLTTGAITGMLNRLQEAGLVRREQDPNDGRRVIVRLAPGQDGMREIDAIVDDMERAWSELAAHSTDEQLAALLAFLRQSNALVRGEVARLRATPEAEGGAASAPLGELTSARLLVSGAARLTVRADADLTDLYQARIEGPLPDVKVGNGAINIRYPRRLWGLVGGQRELEVALHVGIAWRILIEGGASEINAKLEGLDLEGLEVTGGMSIVHVELPKPVRMVPIRVKGDASQITMRRPASAGARVHLKGWVSSLVFDDQRYSDVGNDVRMQSWDFDASEAGYDIEIASSASAISITAG